MLAEAKDTSEIMVDLAYAAVYFNDPGMADELAELEEQLNDWAANSGGLLLGYDRDRYLFVFEEKDYGGYTEKKFDVLEKVRQVQAGEGEDAGGGTGGHWRQVHLGRERPRRLCH